MKANEIKQGGIYEAKVSGNLTRVRVDRIEAGYDWGDRPVRRYHVTNLMSGRKTVFRSAAKFRREVQPNRETQAVRAKQKAQMGIERAVLSGMLDRAAVTIPHDDLTDSLRLIENDTV